MYTAVFERFHLTDNDTMQRAIRGVCLNTRKLDYSSQALNWSRLSTACQSSFMKCDVPAGSSPEAIKELCGDVDVLVVKEMKMDRAVVLSLPPSIQLICEAGTGFNNIDLEACNERGIKVANVADYSSDSVATLVMTAILNFSASVLPIAAQTQDEFVRPGGVQMPLFELAGKSLGLVGGNGTIGRKVRGLLRGWWR